MKIITKINDLEAYSNELRAPSPKVIVVNVFLKSERRELAELINILILGKRVLNKVMRPLFGSRYKCLDVSNAIEFNCLILYELHLTVFHRNIKYCEETCDLKLAYKKLRSN
jgi:hypothetical protein